MDLQVGSHHLAAVADHIVRNTALCSQLTHLMLTPVYFVIDYHRVNTLLSERSLRSLLKISSPGKRWFVWSIPEVSLISQSQVV
jgi:hypothetical protein